eukprot:1923662-Amphidinium_carterae.2
MGPKRSVLKRPSARTAAQVKPKAKPKAKASAKKTASAEHEGNLPHPFRGLGGGSALLAAGATPAGADTAEHAEDSGLPGYPREHDLPGYPSMHPMALEEQTVGDRLMAAAGLEPLNHARGMQRPIEEAAKPAEERARGAEHRAERVAAMKK